MSHLTKEEIISQLNVGFSDVEKTILAAHADALFQKPGEKWSAAENVEHLVLSVKPLSLAFRLPKLVLRYFGKPNRPCRTYQELVNRYHAKLSAGGKATSAFIPHPKASDRNALTAHFNRHNQKFLASLKNWNEPDLDRYLLPHPLLGKLIVREMLYFTIYHTQHHLRAIEKAL